MGHSVDDYLETIYFLAFPIGEYHPATGSSAIAARVAEMLGVPAPPPARCSSGSRRKGWWSAASTGGDPHRSRHRACGRRSSASTASSSVPHRLHGLHPGGVACPGGRARRHVHGRHDRTHQRAARQPGSLPARWRRDTAVEHAENQELVSLSGLERGQRDGQARRARRRPPTGSTYEGLVPGSTLSTSALSMATPPGQWRSRWTAWSVPSAKLPQRASRAPLASRRDIRHLPRAG